MVSAMEFKRGVTGAGILGIVVGKFRHWQQSCPIILLPIDECFEVYFYRAILSLGLAICLQLESCR